MLAGPQLLLNGEPVAKQKGQFQLRTNTGSTLAVKMKIRLLDPIPNLVAGGQTIEVAPALAWYQYLWMGLPVLLVFGGGAIGGICGGLAAGVSGRIFRGEHSEGTKYAITGLISVAALLTYYVAASAFSAAIGK